MRSGTSRHQRPRLITLPVTPLLAIATAALVIVATPAHAGVIRVDAAGGGDHETIQDGLDAASPGDTVLVAPGTYEEHISIGPSADGVALIGELGPDVTTVNNQSTYPFSVLHCFNVGQGTRVEGLHFIRGYSDAHGGGVRCDSASVHFDNVSMSSCSALESHGGGIGGVDSDIVITNSFIGNNRAGIGGGIALVGGSLTVDGTTVFGNSADWISLDQIGGGVYASCDVCVVTDCRIESNNALAGGGIALVDCGGADIAGNDIIRNHALELGGGLYVTNTVCTVADNQFTSNSATTVGGGAIDIGSMGALARPRASEFSGNTFFMNRAIGSEAAIRLSDGGTAPVFHDNYFADDTLYEVLVRSSLTRETIDFTGNWWDTVDPLEIGGKVYDCDDDPSLLWCVDYSDWCPEASCGGEVTVVEDPETTSRVNWGRLKSLYR